MGEREGSPEHRQQQNATCATFWLVFLFYFSEPSLLPRNCWPTGSRSACTTLCRSALCRAIAAQNKWCSFCNWVMFIHLTFVLNNANQKFLIHGRQPEVTISELYIRAVYTRENKPRITQSVAYVSRELGHLYDHGLYKKLVRSSGKPRTSFLCRSYEQFAAYISRGLCNPRLILPRINGPIVSRNNTNVKQLLFTSVIPFQTRIDCNAEIVTSVSVRELKTTVLSSLLS